MQPEGTLLLRTKLDVPPSRSHTLSRTRLLTMIPHAPETRLLLLSAPAGFGKTTLLATWCRDLLAQPGTAVAWLALDQRDNDPQRFLAYLMTAVEQALSIERCETRAPALAVPNNTTIEIPLTTLVNTIAASDSNVVLVLDDYHLISAPVIHAAVAFLLEHLPNRACLAIGSRADPPLPLARLRAREQLFELRAADLRFTPDEIQAFFAANTLALTPEEVQIISAHVEGWPAGVQLTALALRAALREQTATWEATPSNLPAGYLLGRLNGSQQHVFAYLADDVFEQQPGHRKAFLLQTSILERMCGSLCDAVLGVASEEQARSDTQNTMLPAAHPADSYSRLVLEEIEHANLFIMSLDSERGWYRYHHLFRAFLSDQLDRESPALISELHRRASAWYEQHQLLPYAIDHALAAGELRHAAALIEPLANTLVAHGQYPKLQQWLAQIPDHILVTRPALCSSAAQAGLLADQGRSFADSAPAHCGWARTEAMLEPLSERELEVLRLIASGASNQAIAQSLVISIGTVKSHINHILGKLAASNRTEAVSHARQYGLLKR